MTTSNLSAGGSRPNAKGASASEIRTAKRKRSFIPDVYYLKCLFPRRKFEADPLAALAIEERFGDRGHPAHPIAIHIGLIHPHDAIARFGSVAFPHRDGRAKSNDIRWPTWGWDDLRRLQTFLELHDALIEPGQLSFGVRIIARFGERWPLDLDQSLKLLAQFLRARRRDVILRPRRQRRSQRRKVGKLRRIIIFAREGFAHSYVFPVGRDSVEPQRITDDAITLPRLERVSPYRGDAVGVTSGNANVEVGDAPGAAGVPEGDGDTTGVGLGVGVGVGLGNGGIIFSQRCNGTPAPPISFTNSSQRVWIFSRSGGPNGVSAVPGNTR